MAGMDLLTALAPSLAGNAAALTLGVAHGSSGDMPRLGAKKDEKGVPILDKDGNQTGGVPYDALVAGAGYMVGSLLTIFAKGKVKDIGGQIALRVGDAGAYIYTYSWGGQMGQKSRKDAGKLSGQANSRTVTSGESRQSMGEGNREVSRPQTRSEDPHAELSRVFGAVNGTVPNTVPARAA